MRTASPAAPRTRPTTARSSAGNHRAANRRGGQPIAAPLDIENLAREFNDICLPHVRQEVMSRVRNSRETGKLDLLGMALESLPASLPRQLANNLTSLAVNTNSLSTLPEHLGLLRALQSLM